MTYDIDVFIRQLQSSIAKRNGKLTRLEERVGHCKDNYHRVKKDALDYIASIEEVDADVLSGYLTTINGWRNTLKLHKQALAEVVEQQRTERKMLAYFINEKRYMSTK